MIKHSEALESWDKLWGASPIPFKAMNKASFDTPVKIFHTVQIVYMYFRIMKESKETKGYVSAQKAWLMIAPFFPTITPLHKSLHSYFTQTLRYTPIHYKTGKKLL